MNQWGWHIVGVIFLICSAGAVSYFDSKGIRALYTLHTENIKVENENAQLSLDLQNLQREQEDFQSNPKHKERIVRLRTGYLDDNELLIEWLKKE